MNKVKTSRIRKNNEDQSIQLNKIKKQINEIIFEKINNIDKLLVKLIRRKDTKRGVGKRF